MRCTPLLYPSTVELSTLPLVPLPASIPLESQQIILHIKLSRLPGASETRRDEKVGRTTLTPTPSVFFPQLYLAPPSCFISLLWTHAAFFFRQRETLESTSDIFPPPPPLPPTFRGRRVQPYVLPIIDQWLLPPPAAGWRLSADWLLRGRARVDQRGKKDLFTRWRSRVNLFFRLRLSSPNGRDRQTGGVGGKNGKERREERRERVVFGGRERERERERRGGRGLDPTDGGSSV